MLRTLTALEGISIHALDGAIGTVKDTYFDDSRRGNSSGETIRTCAVPKLSSGITSKRSMTPSATSTIFCLMSETGHCSRSWSIHATGCRDVMSSLPSAGSSESAGTSASFLSA